MRKINLNIQNINDNSIGDKFLNEYLEKKVESKISGKFDPEKLFDSFQNYYYNDIEKLNKQFSDCIFNFDDTKNDFELSLLDYTESQFLYKSNNNKTSIQEDDDITGFYETKNYGINSSINDIGTKFNVFPSLQQIAKFVNF